ncbi:MAG: hypothetical protein IPK72_11460 [Candidatus Eisenbacteria bacterium]|nr:hypothetical protein [Candidatus Eisenbacteria bacterium]
MRGCEVRGRTTASLGALLFVAAMLSSTPGAAAVSTTTLYATSPAYGPQVDWQNAQTVFGPPVTDCDDGDPQYALNEVPNSEEWLEVRHWDPLQLPSGHQITRVYVDVNGRYDNPSGQNRFVVSVGVRSSSAPSRHPEWTQTTFDCAWRMETQARRSRPTSAANGLPRTSPLSGYPYAACRTRTMRVVVAPG